MLSPMRSYKEPLWPHLQVSCGALLTSRHNPSNLTKTADLCPFCLTHKQGRDTDSQPLLPQQCWLNTFNTFHFIYAQIAFLRDFSMRLLKALDPDGDESGTVLPQLIDFPPDRIPNYAILSHRWGAPEDEVLFADIIIRDPEHRANTRNKIGYRKVDYSCRQALKDGFEYVWVS
jgi:hypothetical protein